MSATSESIDSGMECPLLLHDMSPIEVKFGLPHHSHSQVDDQSCRLSCHHHHSLHQHPSFIHFTSTNSTNVQIQTNRNMNKNSMSLIASEDYHLQQSQLQDDPKMKAIMLSTRLKLKTQEEEVCGYAKKVGRGDGNKGKEETNIKKWRKGLELMEKLKGQVIGGFTKKVGMSEGGEETKELEGQEFDGFSKKFGRSEGSEEIEELEGPMICGFTKKVGRSEGGEEIEELDGQVIGEFAKKVGRSEGHEEKEESNMKRKRLKGLESLEELEGQGIGRFAKKVGRSCEGNKAKDKSNIEEWRKGLESVEELEGQVTSGFTKKVGKSEGGQEKGESNIKRRRKGLESPPLEDQVIEFTKKVGSSDMNKEKAKSNVKRNKKGLESLQELEHMLTIDKGKLSKREIHIYSERCRRRGMSQMLSNLKALIPYAKPKTDKCMILNEAISYIKALQTKLEDMVTKKQTLLVRSIADYCEINNNTIKNEDANNANMGEDEKVGVKMSGHDLFITINATTMTNEEESGPSKRRIIWSRILQALLDFQLEVVNATLSASSNSYFHYIHAKILDATTFENENELKASLLQLFL